MGKSEISKKVRDFLIKERKKITTGVNGSRNLYGPSHISGVCEESGISQVEFFGHLKELLRDELVIICECLLNGKGDKPLFMLEGARKRLTRAFFHTP